LDFKITPENIIKKCKEIAENRIKINQNIKEYFGQMSEILKVTTGTN